MRYLRNGLNDIRVYDLFYPAIAEAGLREAGGPAYRLTGDSLSDCEPVIVFAGRVPGETSLTLFRQMPGEPDRCHPE